MDDSVTSQQPSASPEVPYGPPQADPASSPQATLTPAPAAAGKNRSAKNHWWLVVLASVVCNLIPPVLWLKTPSSVSWAGVFVMTAVFVFAVRRLTCSRRWWIAAIVGSPFVVGPFLLGVLLVGAIMGIVPVP
jgi:hypothetical protein